MSDGSPKTESVRLLSGIAALVALVAAAGVLVFRKILIAIDVGPGWDTYALLDNAAHFAGRSVGYVEMHRPPLMPLLTSLVFRTGWMETAVIQWVDGALSVAAIVAFYLILRRRLSIAPSIIGALSLLAIPGLWVYLGTGYTDLPSTGIALWGLVLLFKATEDHPGWYLAAFPMLVLALLTRYGTLVVGVPVLGLLYLRSRPFRHWKYMLAGVGLAIATYIPAGIVFNEWLGDALMPILGAFSSATGTLSTDSAEGVRGGLDTGYLQSLPSLLAPENVRLLVYVLLGMSVLGYIAWLMENWKQYARAGKRWVPVIIAVGAALLAQSYLGAAGRQITILVGVLVATRMLAETDEDGRTTAIAAVDAVMLLWLLGYVDAHEHLSVKISRYFIPIAPALIYFVLLGWSHWIDSLNTRWKRQREAGHEIGLPRRALEVAVWTLAGILMMSGVAVNVAADPPEPDPLVAGARETALWMTEGGADLEGSLVYSDLWPLTSWYLGQEAQPMPTFAEPEAFEHDLNKYGVDYYVTIRGRRFDEYDEVAKSGPVVVLARDDSPLSDKPRILLSGDAWDNYLESLTAYRMNLIYTNSRVEARDLRRLETLGDMDLSEYEAVAAFDMQWSDRAEAEGALREYVESGGVLIIDASANLDGMGDRLGDTVWLDTLIRRHEARPDAPIHVSPRFAEEYPLTRTIDAAPFVDETGGPWFGATYSEISKIEGPEREEIAWLDGEPIVTVQPMGEGRIYWVGMNLFWHAFFTENRDEAALVNAVLEDALGSSTKDAEDTGKPSS